MGRSSCHPAHLLLTYCSPTARPHPPTGCNDLGCHHSVASDFSCPFGPTHMSACSPSAHQLLPSCAVTAHLMLTYLPLRFLCSHSAYCNYVKCHSLHAVFFLSTAHPFLTLTICSPTAHFLLTYCSPVSLSQPLLSLFCQVVIIFLDVVLCH